MSPQTWILADRRTDGRSGDFILCPMLGIALDRQLLQSSQPYSVNSINSQLCTYCCSTGGAWDGLSEGSARSGWPGCCARRVRATVWWARRVQAATDSRRHRPVLVCWPSRHRDPRLQDSCRQTGTLLSAVHPRYASFITHYCPR